MATLSVQTIPLAGVKPSYTAAAAAGDEFANNGRTFLHVKNSSVSAITVTLTTPASIDGVAITDPTISVPGGEERMIGPFPQSIFNNANGRVAVGYSAVTDVTVAAFSI